MFYKQASINISVRKDYKVTSFELPTFPRPGRSQINRERIKWIVTPFWLWGSIWVCPLIRQYIMKTLIIPPQRNGVTSTLWIFTNSSLLWSILLLFYALFVQWSITVFYLPFSPPPIAFYFPFLPLLLLLLWNLHHNVPT